MHRSPLPVLVIFAAIAACSTRDASAETELLAKDSTLVARLAVAPAAPAAVAPAARRVSLPDACGTVASPARPAAAHVAQAESLARRGYDAEALGDLQEARTLLSRASELDGTNESAVYHLGRASEALGDRAAAVSAYCRFLSLTPTAAESDEARQRVTRLSQPATQLAAGAVGDSAPARQQRARATQPPRVARRRATVAPRVVASTAVERSPAPASPEIGATSVSAATVGADSSAPARGPVASAPAGETVADNRSAASGDVIAATAQEPTAVLPPTASRTGRGGLSRAQSAGIGAAAGAIIGAATGRGVKGAVIGAAAGGVLGTVVGGRIGPSGRGIRPYQPYQPYRPYRR